MKCGRSKEPVAALSRFDGASVQKSGEFGSRSPESNGRVGKICIASAEQRIDAMPARNPLKILGKAITAQRRKKNFS